MKLIKQILLFGIAFLGVVFFSEIFIRITHIASVSSTDFYDDIGRGRRRNLNYLYFNEGFGIGEFNNFRYIGESNPPEKSEKTIRIGLIGDSYVESFHVFQRDYFGTIAENILNENKANINYEFLNFGRSGFDIGNMYAYQKTFVDFFNPDLVLYFISNEDLEIKNSDLLRPSVILKNENPFVSLDFDKSVIKSFNKTKFLVQNSVVLNMLNNCRKKSKQTPVLEILLDKIYFWMYPKRQNEEEINITNKQMDLLVRKILKSLDAEKTILVNKRPIKFSNELKEICEKKGLQIIDLTTLFHSMENTGIDPIEWKVTRKRGHWNPAAHKAIGQEITKQLRARLDTLN